ncbi:MAG: iron ABC transporter permease [Beijerinckiaceae bacterium]|nr:iron ABC transporter permease [Beijerinckiaceae bacterium]
MERNGGIGIIGLSLAGLGTVVAVPMLFVLLQAIFPHLGENSLREPFGAVWSAFADPRLPELLANTVRLGVCVAVACTIVATPLAVLRALTDLPGKGLWDLLFLIPFMMPPYIGAFAWTMTLQPGGFTTQIFGANGGAFLFSFWGIVTVMTLHLFPVVYFAVSRTLAAIGPRYIHAARTSGAGPLYAFWRITLPLSLPGLAASLLLVFAMSIEEYGTPATLGRQAQYLVLVTSIEERFAEWPIDLPGAAILSLNLVLLALAAFLLQHWIVTRRSYVTISGKHGDASTTPLGAWRWPAVMLFALVAALAVVIPMAAVLITATSNTISGGLAWNNIGLRHFESVLSNRDGAMDALFTSLWLAGGASLGAGLLGLLAAYVTVRSRAPGRGAVDALSTLPNALPGMVVAVGLILAWNRSWWPVQIYNTSFMLLLAYICLLLPYPVRYAAAGLRQISQSLEAAARVSGAGLAMTIRRIVLPMIAPHLAVAMMLVFAIAMRELVASVMVAPPGLRTVSTYVFNQFVQGSAGEGMALSVIAIFSSTAILVAMSRFQKNLEH